MVIVAIHKCPVGLVADVAVRPAPRRFWWLTRIAIATLILAVAWGVFWWRFSTLAGGKLAAAQAELNAEMSPFLAELDARTSVPEDEDAVPLLRQAVERLSALPAEIRRPFELRSDAAERREAVRQLLNADGGVIFELVRAARAHGRVYWGDPRVRNRFEALDPPLRQTKAIGWQLLAAADWEREQGRIGDALARIRDACFLARVAGDTGILAGQSIEIGITAAAAEMLSQIAADESVRVDASPDELHAWSAELRAGLLALLVRDRWRRIGQLAMVDDYYDNLYWGQRLETQEGRSVMDAPFRTLDLAQFTRGTRGVLQQAAAQTWGELYAVPLLVSELDQPFSLLTAEIWAFRIPDLRRFDTLCLQRAMRCEMVAAALALRLYELEHGAPPQTLAELVPTYLPSVPRDALRDGAPPIVWHQGANAFLSAGQARGDPTDPNAYPVALRLRDGELVGTLRKSWW